jgi:hypothetical protein
MPERLIQFTNLNPPIFTRITVWTDNQKVPIVQLPGKSFILQFATIALLILYLWAMNWRLWKFIIKEFI